MATAEAQKKWRNRLRDGLLRSCVCGRRLREESGVFCFGCWLKTDEGRAYNQERYALAMARKIDLVAEAKAIASKFSNELGFVNSAALTESLGKKALDVLPGIGFAHWHHRRDGQTTIYSLAVAKDRQGEGWGRLLFSRVLCSLVERRMGTCENRFSIVAKCPEDLVANAFYQAMGFDLVEVEPGRKRSLNVWRYQVELPFLFYCGAGGKSKHDTTAAQEGWRLGLRSNGKNKAHIHMQMIDNEWGAGYNHEQHSSLVKEQKPLLATIRDIESLEQLPEALKHARELAPYCGRVMLIPKVKCWLPDYYWLGFSIPTSHGGTMIETEWFCDRPVHLLGGDANDQARYAKRLNVVSLDHNAAMRLADFGKAMHQYINDSGEHTGKGCYEAMRVSFQKQKYYWHTDLWQKDRPVEQLSLI